VLDNFVYHAVQLDDFDAGWKQFMRKYLSSIQHIVGQQAIVIQSSKSDAASVPTSFIEELEGLRSKVEELDEEVRCALAPLVAGSNSAENTIEIRALRPYGGVQHAQGTAFET
jgi:hypothetical protein